MTSFSKAFQFKRNTFLIHFGKYLWHLSYFCRFMLYKLALSKCDKRNWKVNCRPCPPKDNIVGIWSQYFHFSSTSIYVHCPLLWVAIQEFIRQIYKQYSHICIHISLNWNSSIILYSWSSIMYCITGYALFLEYPSHHIYWFCSVHPLLVQIFQDSTTITDLEMEGQVKPKVLLGIKDFFEMAALWFIPKLVFPALFVLIKNLADFLTLYTKTL